MRRGAGQSLLFKRLTVACNTCLDRRVVSKIIGGVRFTQPCPDCNGGSWS